MNKKPENLFEKSFEETTEDFIRGAGRAAVLSLIANAVLVLAGIALVAMTVVLCVKWL